ncbi:Uncharacterised protein [Escherichia coli]|uniref:Uncharacterized protein n=1 Tax=Escherichia coli TaxID=562 RepID=A0A376LPU7_ECOLX|nr:Uncharacterised protein [Escherichia coli]
MGDYLKAPPPPRTKEQVLKEARDQIDRGLFFMRHGSGTDGKKI